MSRVEELKKARDSLSVKFLEFTRAVSKGLAPVFFEGEDEKYYAIRINNIRPDLKWTGVNCKGKSNVLMMRDKIRNHSTYKEYVCLFFVDSDFEDNSNFNEFDDLYVTPCYSVENLYFTEKAFKQILSAEFGVSETAEEYKCFENCIFRFRDIKNQFIDAIEGFNRLVFELRKLEQTGKLQGRLNINNIGIDELVKIGLFEVEKVYSELSPSEVFSELPNDLNISFEESAEYFENKCFETWFRGKQNLEFYRHFLVKLKGDRCKRTNRKVFQNRGNVRLQLTKANAISELSQYAETPDCLRRFLESIETDEIAAEKRQY